MYMMMLLLLYLIMNMVCIERIQWKAGLNLLLLLLLLLLLESYEIGMGLLRQENSIFWR